MWAFFAVLLLGGGMLYNALSASEETAEAPSVFAPSEAPRTRIASPPPLRVPDRFGERSQIEARPTNPAPALTVQSQPVFFPQISPPISLPSVSSPLLPDVQPAQAAAPDNDIPEVVFRASDAPRGTARTSLAEEEEQGGRIQAERLRNPSFTIPQGTVIPAVLETALDSTRAGGVRALVQRNVLSFDGTRVLVPRGSRLYGEYEANLQRGQNRALVQWTRLIRPDGVTIALDSPSSDPLGRAGIRGKVDSKFLQRFGGAILQSVLDIGVGLAVNEASNGVLLALPGSTQNVQITDPQAIQPTLKVNHGTSVSVFVARDLDFSSVDR
ncbi:TrbI/VirB10 family protein [Erythrobacter sp.]